VKSKHHSYKKAIDDNLISCVASLIVLRIAAQLFGQINQFIEELAEK
jgi:hypothetical protein